MMLSVRILFLLLTFLCTTVQAGENNKIDYLSLAALMIRDGAVEKAAESLEKVNIKDEKTDLLRFYTLRGLLGLQQQDFVNARNDFLQYLKLAKAKDKPVENIMYVYLAQAYYGNHEYENTLKNIAKSGDAGEAIPRIWHLKSTTLWKLGRKKDSWKVLQEAENKFPEDSSFLRKQVFLLIDMGLYQTAANTGLSYLQKHQTSLLDYLAIGRAMAASNQMDKALVFLEKAVLKYPYSAKAKAVLAHVYIKQHEYAVAADLMERAAVKNRVLLLDAAELRKKSGQINRALYLNSQVIDQHKKLKQRLALLLGSGQYDQAASMENDLYRTDLLADESVRYALAYAFYRSGIFVSADDYLDTLTSPGMFSKAAVLRSAMEACASEPWKCIN